MAQEFNIAKFLKETKSGPYSLLSENYVDLHPVGAHGLFEDLEEDDKYMGPTKPAPDKIYAAPDSGEQEVKDNAWMNEDLDEKVGDFIVTFDYPGIINWDKQGAEQNMFFAATPQWDGPGTPIEAIFADGDPKTGQDSVMIKVLKQDTFASFQEYAETVYPIIKQWMDQNSHEEMNEHSKHSDDLEEAVGNFEVKKLARELYSVIKKVNGITTTKITTSVIKNAASKFSAAAKKGNTFADDAVAADITVNEKDSFLSILLTGSPKFLNPVANEANKAIQAFISQNYKDKLTSRYLKAPNDNTALQIDIKFAPSTTPVKEEMEEGSSAQEMEGEHYYQIAKQAGDYSSAVERLEDAGLESQRAEQIAQQAFPEGKEDLAEYGAEDGPSSDDIEDGGSFDGDRFWDMGGREISKAVENLLQDGFDLQDIINYIKEMTDSSEDDDMPY